MMPKQGESKGGASAYALSVLHQSLGVTKRQTKSWGKRAWRYFKMAAWMLTSAIVIPITMISLGILLGPRGYEGLVAAPVAVLASWALILFFGLRRRVTPRKIARAQISELPATLSEFLDSHRSLLPAPATRPLDGILQQLEEIEPALYLLKDDSPYVPRLRRLLSDDLTGLMDHYRRLPPRLRDKKLHGGPTPAEQLTSGLSTIQDELARLHDELSREDLYSLATKERYLEMKYGSSSKDRS